MSSTVAAMNKTVTENGTTGLPIVDAPLIPVGYTQLTSLAAATALSPQKDSNGNLATIAQITIEAQSVRYRDDGIAPTATVGQLYPAGTILTLSLVDFTKAQFIAAAAGAIVNVSWYRS